MKPITLTAAGRSWLLALYIVAAAAVFLYLGFPSETLRGYIGQRLSAGLPGLSVAVGAVRPSLTAGLVLSDVRIAHAQTPVAVLDRVHIHPELWSLLENRTRYVFDGSLGGGGLNGQVEIDAAGAAPNISLNARISGVLIQQIEALSRLYGSRLSGRLDGNFQTTDTGALNGKLTITDGQIELAAPVLAQDRFTFKTVEADLTLQDHSLRVRSGRLRGNELDADLSGSIALDSSRAPGSVNLAGRVTPHHALLARAEGSLPPGFLRRRAGVPFRISGSLEAPGFSLN
jgi:type II secretion system protein N